MSLLVPAADRFLNARTLIRADQPPGRFTRFDGFRLYRFGPSRDAPQWLWVMPGSIFAAVVWLVASILFSWYAAKFGSFNKTYGSLGAIIGFMIWMWISAIVVLLGGMLNAELEYQTEKDTTVGRPQPMGSRGAYVADRRVGTR